MHQAAEFFFRLFHAPTWRSRRQSGWIRTLMPVKAGARSNAQQIETLFHAAPDAIIVVNSLGNIINWNPRAESMFGWSKREILNRSLAETVIPERHRAFHRRSLLHYMKTGETNVTGKPVEIRVINRSGLEFDVALSISPMKNRGQLLFIGFVRDISGKKRDEEKIRELNARLEERVLERTAQLYNSEQKYRHLTEDLENRIKWRTIELENTNKEMEAFTYSVSHDLRAPLRAISGFATILEEDYGANMDSEAQRLMGVIRKKAVKMGRLIDELLAFSRLGRQFISINDIHTQGMVQEVIDDLLQQNPSEAVSWKLSALPDIRGDINTLRQVWINLLSNALKYSGGREHPVIEIGSFVQDGMTSFFVKDNGVGFNNKYKHKLFNVFQRLHSDDEFEGTGVGLALVAKIVSKHGGTVWAEGTVDKGASFYFSLPAIGQPSEILPLKS